MANTSRSYLKRVPYIVMLCLILLPHPARADTGLEPPTAGKYLHFLAGMAIGLAAAGVVQIANDPQVPAPFPFVLPTIALSAATVAGMGKELLDSTGFGDPRFTDILITMTGGLAAAAAIAYEESLHPPTHTGALNGATYLLSTAMLLAIPVVNGFVKEITSYEKRQRNASNGA
jgi:hypothetical protein